ncbi:MAG: hypothetical protein ACYC2T_09355 [Bacillota bacterium]
MGKIWMKAALIITLAIILPGLFVSSASVADSEHDFTNRDTDNLNVLFLGVKENKLQMISVYSINYLHNMRSVAIFFPSETLVGKERDDQTLEGIYAQAGVAGLKQAMEQILEVPIAYHVWMDQRILADVEKFIGPIYIGKRRLPMEKLFTMPLSPEDEDILGALLQRFSQPGIYFWQLPRIITVFHNYINTDFQLNLNNLMLHYRIARNINPGEISKILVEGRMENRGGQRVLQVTKPQMKRVVFEYTR